MRMCLAAIHQLDWPDVPSNVAQPLLILKEKIGTLIGAGSPSEANGQQLWIELHSKRPANFGKQFRLCVSMRFTNGGQRNADGITQIVIIGAPTLNIGIRPLPEPP